MTTGRKYSINEIDRMRTAICDDLHSQNTGFLRDSVRQVEERAEQRLRTYMLNGTDPEEIETAVRERAQKLREWENERVRKEGFLVTTSSDGKQTKRVFPGDPLWNKHRFWDKHPVIETPAVETPAESVDSASWTGR